VLQGDLPCGPTEPGRAVVIARSRVFEQLDKARAQKADQRGLDAEAGNSGTNSMRRSRAVTRRVRAHPRAAESRHGSSDEGVYVLSKPSNRTTRERSQERAWPRPTLALMAIVALGVLAGCGGSSKPAYCSDRTNLDNSVKSLPSVTSSSGLSGLKSQISKIQSDATALVNSAKGDFPTQTTAIKSSVDTLASAVKALPSSPSASQVAAIAADSKSVVSSVNSFSDASKSKCG
jgi:hypothetical protein